MKQKKYEEYLKRTLPESEEVECKKCGLKFTDDYNLICLGALELCLLCANRYLDKPTIERAYDVK
jgi:hypothetical protein